MERERLRDGGFGRELNKVEGTIVDAKGYSRKRETEKREIRMRRKRKSIKLFHIETCYFRISFKKLPGHITCDLHITSLPMGCAGVRAA